LIRGSTLAELSAPPPCSMFSSSISITVSTSELDSGLDSGFDSESDMVSESDSDALDSDSVSEGGMSNKNI
jgi:hypothetical protein